MIRRAFRGTRYEARFLELLASAIAGDADVQGELALDSAGAMDGLAITELVAGALGVVRVHFMLGSASALDILAAGMVRRLEDERARLIVAELPDDVPFRDMERTLERAGFEREAAITDFVANGTAMHVHVARASEGTHALRAARDDLRQ